MSSKEKTVQHLKESAREIINNPLLNKGTAFTLEERISLGLLGLLPDHISTMEEQVYRRYQSFLAMPTGIAKYKMLTALQDRNEILFYRLVLEHVGEMLPYVYTPTVGEASQTFSLYYDQPRGVYISYHQKDHLDEMIRNIPSKDVEVMVVTDGSRILGLGDMGVGGMVIPVGKLALYTLFGGIHPSKVLPIMLDMGTDNPALLSDPLYLGWRHPRIKGEEYFTFIDRFVHAIKKKYPNVLLQWEDFSKDAATALLYKHQEDICSFNDDIQGTAATVLAGLYGAVSIRDEKLKDQRIVIVGGGSAGMGIAHLLADGMILEGASFEEARRQIYVIDRKGLVHENHAHPTNQPLAIDPFIKTHAETKNWKAENQESISFLETIKNIKPTVLIGVCAQSKIFSEEIIKEMARGVQRPIVFPLSNPTSKAEADPKDIIEWSEGRAIVATGSPFSSFSCQDQVFSISQANNVYIFPGLGLGVIAVKSSKVTNEMFLIAAKTLADETAKLRKNPSQLYPAFTDLRDVSKKIATSVGEYAAKHKLATLQTGESVGSLVEKVMWYPTYPTYLRADSK